MVCTDWDGQHTGVAGLHRATATHASDHRLGQMASCLGRAVPSEAATVKPDRALAAAQLEDGRPLLLRTRECSSARQA